MTTTAVSPTQTSALQNYLNQQATNVTADQAAAAAAASSGTGSLASATSASMIGSNFNTFIKILTTQLQNQDPSNTTDPNQFTQELVQFAGVEQQLNTNNDLQTLINLQKANGGVTAALNFMGQYVEAPAGSMALQNGTAEIGYNLPLSTKSVSVDVTDASGNKVATLSGSTKVGLNYLAWNGKDSSGNQLPDGPYTFTINATASDGTAETVSDVRVVGKVTGIASNSDGTTSLSLGNGLSVLTSNVDAVYNSGSIPAAT